ncbi:MAG: hypothetical protein MJZ34_15120 [Paludibacteraceae bacterium]|nr:hypothetical protein [Paludibacteraceae bacterium]
MVDYKYNKRMFFWAKEYDLSFENDYNTICLPKAMKYTLTEGVKEEWDGFNVYYMIKSPSFCNQICQNEFEFFYDDLTGNEYSNNKIIFETGKHTRYALMKGISFCHKLINVLPKFHEFNVIMSVDEDYVTISFHLVRDGETWLGDDLEVYKLDAILVMHVKNEGVFYFMD